MMIADAQQQQQPSTDAQEALSTVDLGLVQYRSRRPSAGSEASGLEEHADLKKAREKEAAKMRAKAHRESVNRQLASIPVLQKKIAELSGRVQELETAMADYEGAPPAEKRPEGGIAEEVCVVVGRYPGVQALRIAVDQAYCNEARGFAKRGTFGDDLQQVKNERFQWTANKQSTFKEIPELKAFVDYVLHVAPDLVLRSRGQHGRGIQILDSGKSLTYWIVLRLCV